MSETSADMWADIRDHIEMHHPEDVRDMSVAHGELTMAANATITSIAPNSLNSAAGVAVVSSKFVLIPDGNDYVVDNTGREGLDL